MDIRARGVIDGGDKLEPRDIGASTLLLERTRFILVLTLCFEIYGRCRRSWRWRT